MINHITPQTSVTDKMALSDNFGIADAWPVVTEPFMQWVIEDQFSDHRPPFNKVGVQVVKDVHAVEPSTSSIINNHTTNSSPSTP